MTDVFEYLKISPIINGAGSITPHSGSPMEVPVAAAMAAAAERCFDIGDLQGRASEIIAECTGAEAGIVTSGATAGLLLGTAACVAGLDAIKMGKLPDTTGMRNEFVVPHSHRNSYDHGVRAAGVKLVEAGLADRLVGVGVRDTDAWEIEYAITERTAGILYLARPNSQPPLPTVVAIAQKAHLPVLVDAAAELPPVGNLRRFIAEGADLVVFSGGKALGGPSGSGILCGRRRLVGSALLQQLDLDHSFDTWGPPSQLIDKHEVGCVPRHGIGRSCKVGKEQIVGLLMALSRFVATNDAARREALTRISSALVAALANVPALETRVISDTDGRGVPLVHVSIALGTDGTDAIQVAARLRACTPSVRVDESCAAAGTLILVPTCLRLSDTELIARAFACVLQHRNTPRQL